MPLTSPDANCNTFLDMMLAVINSNQSLTQQQVCDTQTTLGLGQFESQVNNYWYQKCLPNDITAITKHENQQDISQYTSQFSADSAAAQSYGSNADSLVQTANSQVSTDSTNIQTLTQLASMLNTLGFVANMLAK